MVAAPPAVPVEVPQNANALLTPYQMGPFALSHRLVLAPLTRCRAIGQRLALHLLGQLRIQATETRHESLAVKTTTK